ncbi:hypothetical protein B2J88_47170 [Rhodococcus sp. SRB_17]|nr:hypothetical protein [Rhodococcus sp. SRB_17]
MIFEMETPRGMYLGDSDSVDITSHLLPRGWRWEVISSHEGHYQRPDGFTPQKTRGYLCLDRHRKGSSHLDLATSLRNGQPRAASTRTCRVGSSATMPLPKKCGSGTWAISESAQ